MADNARNGFGVKWGVRVAGALVVTGAVLGFGSGVAFADTLKPDSSKPSAGPSVKNGVRKSGYAEIEAVQGEVRQSDVATPSVKGKSPQPGNLSRVGFGW